VKAFLAPGTSVGHLDAEVASGLVIASADLALVLDEAGAIRDIGFGSDDLAAELRNGHGWVGKPWIETVTSESRVKVAAMLGPAAGQQGPRWRHVNHLMPEGASLPILCTVAPLGAAGRRVVFGRDLRPLSQLQQRLVEVQQTMERDYSRLRQAETRYRLLFQMSVDPLVVLDSDTLRVLEANPAAQRLFAHGRRLAGRPLPEMFGTDDRAPLQALLATLRTAGRADDLRAQLADGGPEVLVSASTFRQEGSLLLLVRLEVSAADAEPGAAPEARTRVLKVIEGVPDAFIVTDQEARILMANAAFMDMAQLTADEQARGMPLDRWLGRDGVEFEVLLATLRNRGAVRLYTSTLRGALGALTEVEISAVAVLHGGEPSFGFLMRDTGSRVRPAARAGRNTTRSVEQLTELIGQVPLKELVREATDAIERLAIEAALELTGDNRASAAELLGLSRQSLYVKLRRYGLGDLGVDDPAEG
jgi:transcriptional regulator PpsR